MGLPLRAHSSKRYFCTKYLVLKIYLGKSDGERQILAFKSHPSRSKREAATHGSQLFPKQQLRDALALRGRVEIIGQGRGQSTTKEQEAATGEVETPLWRFNGKDGGHNLVDARKALWQSAETLTASWSLRGANFEAQATCITLMSRAAHNAGLELLNFEYVSGMNRTDDSTHSTHMLPLGILHC